MRIATRQRQGLSIRHTEGFCSDCHAQKEEVSPGNKYKDAPECTKPDRGYYLNQHEIDGKINPASISPARFVRIISIASNATDSGKNPYGTADMLTYPEESDHVIVAQAGRFSFRIRTGSVSFQSGLFSPEQRPLSMRSERSSVISTRASPQEMAHFLDTPVNLRYTFSRDEGNEFC